MIRRFTTDIICFVYRLAYKIMIHDEYIVTVESYFSKLKYVKWNYLKKMIVLILNLTICSGNSFNITMVCLRIYSIINNIY